MCSSGKQGGGYGAQFHRASCCEFLHLANYSALLAQNRQMGHQSRDGFLCEMPHQATQNPDSQELPSIDVGWLELFGMRM